MARSMTPAAMTANESLRPYLRPCTTWRATPSKGAAETARSMPAGPGSRTTGAASSSIAHRTQIALSSGRAAPQAAHRGGASSEASCAIARDGIGQSSSLVPDEPRADRQGSKVAEQHRGHDRGESAMGRFDITPEVAEEWRGKYRASVEPHVDGEVLAVGAFRPTGAGTKMGISKPQLGGLAYGAAHKNGQSRGGGLPGQVVQSGRAAVRGRVWET